MQGLLELAGVPYVGAGVVGSAPAMDKDLFKAVLRDRGIPVTRNVTIRNGDAIENPFGYPVFVKPARLGSSVGIHEGANPPRSWKPGSRSRSRTTTRCSSRSSSTASRSNAASSATGSRSRPCPVRSSMAFGQRLVRLLLEVRRRGHGPRHPAAAAARADRARSRARGRGVRRGRVRGHGPGRLLRPWSDVLVNELNTIPGFTATSVYAKLFEASGIRTPSCSSASCSSRSSVTSGAAASASSLELRPGCCAPAPSAGRGGGRPGRDRRRPRPRPRRRTGGSRPACRRGR